MLYSWFTNIGTVGTVHHLYACRFGVGITQFLCILKGSALPEPPPYEYVERQFSHSSTEAPRVERFSCISYNYSYYISIKIIHIRNSYITVTEYYSLSTE